MPKVTLSVSKTYKNTGSFRSHRENTKKHWKHYFIEDGKFQTEWVNSIKAQFLKTQKRKQLKFVCEKCGCIFNALVKNKKNIVDCPYCEFNS